jgi:DNA-3-methyladenine glycosylase
MSSTNGKLTSDFYLQKCLKVAKQLIGKVLVRKAGKKIYSGIIVETEAYTGASDPASHAYRGKTKRNEYMFAKGGVAYVYFTYGNHYCVNVVVEEENIAHAVLIRALEPLEGIAGMKRNRKTDNIYNLTNGPGKLTKAMEIDTRLNGVNLLGNELYIKKGLKNNFNIIKSTRIGLTKNVDKPYRFYADNNPFVSRVNVNLILKKLDISTKHN